MLCLRGRTSSRPIACELVLGADPSTRIVAEGLDLRSRPRAAVGDDLFDNAQASLDPFHVGRILGSLFGGFVGNQLTHPFFVLKPALESAHGDASNNGYANDDRE